MKDKNMTSLLHALLLAVPFCDLKTRLSAMHTSKTIRKALIYEMGAPDNEALLGQLDEFWSSGAGVWRCGNCGRLWELATSYFQCHCDDECVPHDLGAVQGQREIFFQCLRERWRCPNYGLWVCIRCRSIQCSGSFPGLVDRRKNIVTYHCGIFTHRVDSSGQIKSMEPHCIQCFGQKIG